MLTGQNPLRIGLCSGDILNHVGISPHHPALVAARADFLSTGMRSVVLVFPCEDTPPRIRVVMGLKAPMFEITYQHHQCLKVLQFGANKTTPLLDREAFGHALYQLYKRPAGTAPTTVVYPTTGSFESDCFQLLLAYAPASYCIAATLSPRTGPLLELRYNKYDDPYKVMA